MSFISWEMKKIVLICLVKAKCGKYRMCVEVFVPFENLKDAQTTSKMQMGQKKRREDVVRLRLLKLIILFCWHENWSSDFLKTCQHCYYCYWKMWTSKSDGSQPDPPMCWASGFTSLKSKFKQQFYVTRKEQKTAHKFSRGPSHLETKVG